MQYFQVCVLDYLVFLSLHLLISTIEKEEKKHHATTRPLLVLIPPIQLLLMEGSRFVSGNHLLEQHSPSTIPRVEKEIRRRDVACQWFKSNANMGDALEQRML
jgi:hypothetical protein